jgi:signal transduction histidine kinase
MGSALLGIAAVLIARRVGVDGLPPWLIPAMVFTAGLVLVWSPLDSAVYADARRPNMAGLFERAAWVRALAGLVLASGALWWFAAWEFTETAWVRGLVVPLVLIAAAGLVFAPWWLRLIRQVGVERQQRIREYERAEIAAHLHDSVLQTLTLIRAKSADADAVTKLARAQERDLRQYLYQDRRTAAESVATALAASIADIEDAHGIAIDTVTVGDAPTSDAFYAATQAAREAASNAARHGIGPISVYAELTQHALEIFVRDAGPGFDPGAVPGDRLGIRNSIVGRVRRHGGIATVTSTPGAPTEVFISMPREEQR